MSVGEERTTEQWRKRVYAVWTLIGWTIVAAGVFWVLGKVSSALVPLVMAVILVFLLRGPVNALERRGMKRGLATALCFLVLVLVLGMVNALIWPRVAEQASALIRNFGQYSETAYEWVRTFGESKGLFAIPEFADISWGDAFEQLGRYAPQAGAAAGGIAGQAFAIGGQAATILFDIVIAFVIGFWGLKDLPAIREEMFALAGRRNREEAQRVATEVTSVLGGYLRGQLIVSALTGTLAAVGLAFIPGVREYAIILGLMTAVLNFVPYVGPAVGAAVTTVVAAVAGDVWWYAAVAFTVLFASQQVVDLMVSPRVMSEQVDLHPVLVLLSILTGGALFGAVGILFAIPVAAVGKGLFVHYFEKHTRTELATEDGALFRTSRPDEDAPGGEAG